MFCRFGSVCWAFALWGPLMASGFGIVLGLWGPQAEGSGLTGQSHERASCCRGSRLRQARIEGRFANRPSRLH